MNILGYTIFALILISGLPLLLFAIRRGKDNAAPGEVGLYAGYKQNWRTDYPINGPCGGGGMAVEVIGEPGSVNGHGAGVEYDARTVNAGAVMRLWNGRIEAMAELRTCGG